MISFSVSLTPRQERFELWGMEAGAALGLGLYGWVAAIRVVSGPGVFEPLGLTWRELGALYFAGFVAAGAVWGALQHKSHHLLAAMLQVVLMMLPAVAIALNMGLSYRRALWDLPGVWPALITSVVVIGWLRFWAWRKFERRPSQG